MSKNNQTDNKQHINAHSHEGGEGCCGKGHEGGEGCHGHAHEGGEGCCGKGHEGGEGCHGHAHEGGEGCCGKGHEGGEGCHSHAHEGREGCCGHAHESGESCSGKGHGNIVQNHKGLYLDLSGGIRCGMLTAALIDLGIMTEKEFLSEINSFSGKKYKSIFSDIDCANIKVKCFNVENAELPFGEAVNIINNSALSTAIKQTAYEILKRMKPVGKNSVDNDILDGGVAAFLEVVSVCILIERLNPAFVAATPLALGGGVRTISNYTISVPVPEVTEIIKGINITLGGAVELTDTAGAAIITALTGDFEGNISGIIINEGKGTAPDGKSMLRAILMETRGITGSGEVTEINANIDNTTGEYLMYCAEELYKKGAHDVWFTPVQSNKFRPAYSLGVLCEPEDTRAMSDIIFQRTRAIEVRCTTKSRIALPREDILVKTEYGEVRVRIIYSSGTADYYPEFEDIKKISAEQGISIEDTAEEIIAAIAKYFDKQPEGKI